MGVDTLLIVLSFVILSAVQMYLLINSKKNNIVKLLIVPLVIWYGIVLFYSFDRIYGWPSKNIKNMEESYLYSYMVVTPTPHNKGTIYVWVIDNEEFEKPNVFDMIKDPNKTFYVGYKFKPRSYEFPYNKGTHKKLDKLSVDKSKAIFIRGLKPIIGEQDQMDIIIKDKQKLMERFKHRITENFQE